MTITTLEVYKGDTYCLIADGDKRIYINRQIIDKFDLKEGMDITREQFTEIMFASELRKAQRRGMYLINQNEYSYRQMFEKLQKNYHDDSHAIRYAMQWFRRVTSMTFGTLKHWCTTT